MPLLRSSTRPQAVECFFCLSPSVLPPHLPPTVTSSDRKGKGRAIGEVGSKWNWHCSRCGCWNIRDERGEMKSDIPAMHDPAYNTHSFSARATPSTSHLPSASHGSSSMFCRSCLANQMLIMNMLANYLPDDDDPTFQDLYASLPDYLTSLHHRYPPVCQICQPSVDEALRKADQKAHVEVFGLALRRGQETASGTGTGQKLGWWEVIVWRMRGIGFWTSALISSSVGISSLLPPEYTLRVMTAASQIGLVISSSRHIGLGLLAFNLISVLWFAWDPYWLRRRREHNRDRVKGRDIWLRDMLLILVLRLISSIAIAFNGVRYHISPIWIRRATFAIEIASLIHAFSALESAPRPIPLRLVRPTQLSAPSTPVGPPTGAVSPASRPIHDSLPYNSSQPIAKYNPVFGKSSFVARPNSRLRDDDMEWEPTPPPPLYNGGYTTSGVMRRGSDDVYQEHGIDDTRGGAWDNFAIGKQRLFGQKEGQDETGLEDILAGWGLTEPGAGVHGSRSQMGWGQGALKWFKGGKSKIE